MEAGHSIVDKGNEGDIEGTRGLVMKNVKSSANNIGWN